MATPKKTNETQVKKDTVTKTQATETKASKPSDTRIGEKLVDVMNVTKYGKVNPTNTHVYAPNVVIKNVVLDNWVQVQIDAGILKVVE